MIKPGGTLPEATVAGLDAEEVRRLASIGFHGVLNGQPEAALRLFEGLGTLRPDAGFPRIGSALALMAVGRAADAARVLEDALVRRPDDDEIRVFLGMTLHIANRTHQARAVLEPVVARETDTPIARLARQMLDLPL
jgi:Flp pilus assembly protein TadD